VNKQDVIQGVNGTLIFNNLDALISKMGCNGF